MPTPREHLLIVVNNLEMLAEEIGFLASDTDCELLSLHEFAAELDVKVVGLVEFSGRVI